MASGGLVMYPNDKWFAYVLFVFGIGLITVSAALWFIAYLSRRRKAKDLEKQGVIGKYQLASENDALKYAIQVTRKLPRNVDSREVELSGRILCRGGSNEEVAVYGSADRRGAQAG